MMIRRAFLKRMALVACSGMLGLELLSKLPEIARPGVLTLAKAEETVGRAYQTELSSGDFDVILEAIMRGRWVTTGSIGVVRVENI